MILKISFATLIFLLLSFTIGKSQTDSSIAVKPGIDVLIESSFQILKGKNIALLTNHAGRSRSGLSSVEAFINTSNCRLIKILTPEHGYYTSIPAGESVPDNVISGIPTLSLYGESRKPSAAQFEGCDAVVVDLQEIGIRPYTYISTVYNVMDACADYSIPIYILDRPNPLGGMLVDGPVLDPGQRSFIGLLPIPYIHGCTIGELARMINEEGWLPADDYGHSKKCNLFIIPIKNYHRWMAWEDTGLMWFPTSPHIPSPDAVRGAAVLGMLGELGVVSIGIGTTMPFQYIGSPNFKCGDIEKRLGTLNFPGLQLHLAKYRPSYGMYNGKDCSGFLLKFPLDNLFQPFSTGVKIISALRNTYPDLFNKANLNPRGVEMFNKAAGNSDLLEAIINGASEEELMRISHKGLQEFLLIREKYLLYE